MNPTLQALTYDALDAAGGRCQCRGECGSGHVFDDGGGQCPVRDQWPDHCDLAVTPADPRLRLTDLTTLTAAQARVRCSTCWREAHQHANEQQADQQAQHRQAVAA